MADPTTPLPEAKAAYEAALAASDKAQDIKVAILGVIPIDWSASDSADAAAAKTRTASDAALGVYQAAILNTPEVAALIVQLNTETATMAARVAALKAEKALLDQLAAGAETMTKILGAIATHV